MTVVKDRKIRTALRTNQIVEFVTVTAWKEINIFKKYRSLSSALHCHITRRASEKTREMLKTLATGGCLLQCSSVLKCLECFITVQHITLCNTQQVHGFVLASYLHLQFTLSNSCWTPFFFLLISSFADIFRFNQKNNRKKSCCTWEVENRHFFSLKTEVFFECEWARLKCIFVKTYFSSRKDINCNSLLNRLGFVYLI